MSAQLNTTSLLTLLFILGCGGCLRDAASATTPSPTETPPVAELEPATPEHELPQTAPASRAYPCDECIAAPTPNAHIAFTRAQPIDGAVIASLAAAMGHRRVEFHPPLIELPGGNALAVVSIDTSPPDEQIAEMWDIQTELWHLAIDETSLRRIDAVPTVQGAPIGGDGGAEDCYSIRSFELADHDADGELELQLNANVGYMQDTADEFHYVRVYSLQPLGVAFERRLDWSGVRDGEDDEFIARTTLRWADLNDDSHPDMELTTTQQSCPDECVQLGEPAVTRALWNEATDAWAAP